MRTSPVTPRLCVADRSCALILGVSFRCRDRCLRPGLTSGCEKRARVSQRRVLIAGVLCSITRRSLQSWRRIQPSTMSLYKTGLRWWGRGGVVEEMMPRSRKLVEGTSRGGRLIRSRDCVHLRMQRDVEWVSGVLVGGG